MPPVNNKIIEYIIQAVIDKFIRSPTLIVRKISQTIKSAGLEVTKADRNPTLKNLKNINIKIVFNKPEGAFSL
jgi:hypothetical protein